VADTGIWPDEGKADMRQYISNTITRLRPHSRTPDPAPGETALADLPSIPVRLRPLLAQTWAEKVTLAAADLAQANAAIDLQSHYPGRRPR
jgi:hypothetical protein